MAVSAFSPLNTGKLPIISPETIKSVVYQSITTRITEKSIILDWNTSSEFQNSHFEVERSANMKDFKTVALVWDGFIKEGSGKKYSFKEDNKVLKNRHIVYYRLKQFDLYGNISYSSVVSVQHARTP